MTRYSRKWLPRFFQIFDTPPTTSRRHEQEKHDRDGHVMAFPVPKQCLSRRQAIPTLQNKYFVHYQIRSGSECLHFTPRVYAQSLSKIRVALPLKNAESLEIKPYSDILGKKKKSLITLENNEEYKATKGMPHALREKISELILTPLTFRAFRCILLSDALQMNRCSVQVPLNHSENQWRHVSFLQPIKKCECIFRLFHVLFIGLLWSEKVTRYIFRNNLPCRVNVTVVWALNNLSK